MTTPALLHYAAGTVSSSGVALSDGTVWMHAVTMGRRVQNGQAFDITADTLRQFARNFATGYVRKVPVDYDHGSANGVADGTKGVPKAGTIFEVVAVLDPAELPDGARAVVAAYQDELRAAGLLEDAQRVDVRGLWVRWKPTPRALSMVRDREYTEASVAFVDDFVRPDTEESQGPTLLSVALTNTPFVNDMIPVAASRGVGGSPSVIGGTTQEEGMTTAAKPESGLFSRLLARISGTTGKPVTTEEEADDALVALHTQHTAATQFAREVGHVLGTSETPKAVETIRQLQRDAQAEKTRRETAERTARETGIASVLTKFERKLTPKTKELHRESLERDLTAGQKLGATTTERLLSLLPDGPAGAGQRAAGGNAASRVAKGDLGEQLDTAAKAAIEASPELKALATHDYATAYQRGMDKAMAQLQYGRPAKGSASGEDHPDGGEGDEEGTDDTGEGEEEGAEGEQSETHHAGGDEGEE